MLTFQKYNAIRILISSGENVDVIAETFNCKRETVLLVKKCSTYEQYKQEFSAVKFIAKSRKQQETKAQQQPAPQPALNVGQVKIEATHYMMEELRKNNELLTLISNKLTAIMEELGVLNK